MSKKNIVYVGLDVDETAFYGAGIIGETGKIFEFKCKPDHGVLRKKINELFVDRYEIHLCYEACYMGYSLCRFLLSSPRVNYHFSAISGELYTRRNRIAAAHISVSSR